MRLLRCAPHELLEREPDEAARERNEGVRVAYVAATRARDLLVIPAVGDEPLEGWLSPLSKAIYPHRSNWRKSAPLPGFEFGDATVTHRPPEYDREGEFSVRPGIVQPQCGEHTVVWWDPWKLALNIEGELGFERQQETLLAEDGGASMARYRAWSDARAEAIGRGAKPSLDVFLASQAEDGPLGEEIPVEIAMIERPAARTGGRRFGTLVHMILRDVALDSDQASIGKIVALNARIVGASESEHSAARAAVIATLAHPLLVRARAAEQVRREYPIVCKLDDHRLLDGIIDLAFVDRGEWVVVDFKTEDSLEAYIPQVRWYAYALAKLTGKKARAVLLGV
jgi:hypothetical protein